MSVPEVALQFSLVAQVPSLLQYREVSFRSALGGYLKPLDDLSCLDIHDCREQLRAL